MRPTISGHQIAKDLYCNSRADTYQVRTASGNKIAEFDNPEETRNFLRDRDRRGIEIWLLKGVPGELIEIADAAHFFNNT